MANTLPSQISPDRNSPGHVSDRLASLATNPVQMSVTALSSADLRSIPPSHITQAVDELARPLTNLDSDAYPLSDLPVPFIFSADGIAASSGIPTKRKRSPDDQRKPRTVPRLMNTSDTFRYISEPSADDPILLSPTSPALNDHENPVSLPSPMMSPTVHSPSTFTTATQDPSLPDSLSLSNENIPLDLIHIFDSAPESLKGAVVYNLLRRCSRKTLSSIASLIVPSLRRDFIGCLPPELSLRILSLLDVKSLCRLATVSKPWYDLISNSDYLWRTLLAREMFHYLPQEIDLLSHTEKENPYKALFREKYILQRNWRDPNFRPYRITSAPIDDVIVTCLHFNSDKIIVAAGDSNIMIYDCKTGKLLQELIGHTGGVWSLQCRGNTLVSGSTDRTLRVWDLTTYRCTHVLEGHVSTVRCLNIVEPAPTGEVDPATGKPKMFPPRPLLVTGSRDTTLRVWKLPLPGECEVHPNKMYREYTGTVKLNPPTMEEISAKVTSVGDPVESDSRYDGPNPFLISVLRGHDASVRSIATHGDVLASASYDNDVRIWSLSTAKCTQRLVGHTNKVYSVLLDVENKRCMSGSLDSTIRVWSLETGECLHVLVGHTSLVGILGYNALSSSPTLVSGCADTTLRTWNLETGKTKHVFEGHSGSITCFHHDDHQIVSGAVGSVKVWDVNTGEFIRDITTGLHGVWQVRFNSKLCVAAVQRDRSMFIEIFDFSRRQE
ncbi:hypothetical protein CANCADRAFT_31196 [Tortispora caseinolytica NRRL Y-17796]|uniref:F-box domain-containing protein n=1 Tax=Tortispora caseinolytica NRRL Y-17796 TaxID=767744 RepID=A0A1E4TEG7_9ASCO|nr:hypothetical protein CANCADRAFT_31196 [Tortispora caseinolytica NRRL Y-17796]